MFEKLISFFTRTKKQDAIEIKLSDNSISDYVINDPSTPFLVDKVLIPKINFLQYKVSNLSFSPKNKAEQQALNCYITIGNCINYVQKNNKLPIKKWAATSCLQVIPQAGQNLNAYYDRTSLKFFFYKAKNKTLFTSDSSDIVAHELGHALLDSIRPDFWNVQSLEIWSFHEAFSDIVALVSVMQYEPLISRVLEETKNDLYKSNSISKLAEEFGSFVFQLSRDKTGILNDCLRNPALEKFKYVDPKFLPSDGKNNQLLAECHSFGRVFSGAWYQIFVEIFNKELEKNPPVIALKNARDICFSSLLQAIPNSPCVTNYYSAIAKSMMLVFKIKYPNYLVILDKVFSDWNIIKPSIKIMSNLHWKDIIYKLKKEDQVIKTNSNTIVKIIGEKNIKLNNNISILSNNLNNLEIEVPKDKYYEFDQKGNLIDEIIETEEEIIDSAKICLQAINNDKETSKMWSEKEGKLIRNFIS